MTNVCCSLPIFGVGGIPLYRLVRVLKDEVPLIYCLRFQGFVLILQNEGLLGFSTSGADGFLDALTLTLHFPIRDLKYWGEGH